MKNANFECRFTVQLISYRFQPQGQYGTSKAHHDVWHGFFFAEAMKGDTIKKSPSNPLQNYTMNLVIRMCFQVYMRWSDSRKKKFKTKIHLTRSVHFNEAQLIKLLYKLILSPANSCWFCVVFWGVQNQHRVALIPNKYGQANLIPFLSRN